MVQIKMTWKLNMKLNFKTQWFVFNIKMDKD